MHVAEINRIWEYINNLLKKSEKNVNDIMPMCNKIKKGKIKLFGYAEQMDREMLKKERSLKKTEENDSINLIKY